MFNKLKERANKKNAEKAAERAKQYIEYDMEQRERTKLNPRNNFDITTTAEKVTAALKEKKVTPQSLYLGFDPTSCKGEIVVSTNKGYVFVSLDGSLVTAGGCWSDFVFWELYCAQEKLSTFLKELGKTLNVEVVDRCLYGAFLDYEIYSEYDPSSNSIPEEVKAFYLEKQEEFRKKYATQLKEMKQFDSWISYHNQGFEFRYIPLAEVQKAINAIYTQRKLLEENDCWDDARRVVDYMYDIIYDRVGRV